jgi:hypothetical protein
MLACAAPGHFLDVLAFLLAVPVWSLLQSWLRFRR